MSHLEPAVRLRESERAARDDLERGCRKDALAIARIVAGPLRDARLEWETELAAMGSLGPTLRRNLLLGAAEEIGLRCARRAFANADVRFRARFALYAAALASAEACFFNSARAAASPGATLRARRTVALPRLKLDDAASIVPRSSDPSREPGAWFAELGAALREALASDVDRACSEMLERGSLELARARVAVGLAQRRGRAPG